MAVSSGVAQVRVICLCQQKSRGSQMEKERMPEAWIGEIVSLGLGVGVSVGGRLEAVNDRGVVLHVSPAYHTRAGTVHVLS